MARSPKPKTNGEIPMKLPLQDISTDFLLCRRGHLGHRWEWSGDYDITMGPRNRPIQAKRAFICARCGVVKTQEFRLPSMEPMDGVRMHYPNGYLSNHRITALEVRREHFQRLSIG